MRRPVRRLLWGVGALLALLLLLVTGVFVYLRSAAGGELVRQKLLDGVNGAIAGKLEAGKATLWGETVVLEDLKLYSPEGELVASVQRVEAHLDLAALAVGEVMISNADVNGAMLLLHRDAQGLSLSRAVAPKIAAVGAALESSQGGVTVRVGQLALRDSRVEYRDDDRTVRLEKVSITGAATVRTGPLDLEGGLALQGQLEGPVADHFVMSVHAAKAARGAWTAEVTAEGAGLSLAGTLDSAARRLTLHPLAVKQSLGKAFLPEGWPLADAEVKGTLGLNDADLELSLGNAGKAKVAAHWEFGDGKAGGRATVSVDDVNLARLHDGLPSTRIGGTVTGAFTDLRLGSLSGSMEAKGQWHEETSTRVLELDAKLEADRGVVKLEPVTIELPGAQLAVQGTVSEAKLDLKGHLRADDAGLAARTLAHGAGVEIPALTGRGTLDVSIFGAVLNPSVRVSGKLASVGVGALSGTGVEVSGAMPSVRRWRETDATLSVQKLQVGDTSFEAVRLGLETQGRDISVELSSKGLTALVVRAAGRLEGDNALALATASFEVPGTVWSMTAPSRLSWEDGIDLALVQLRAGTQGLEVELHKPPGKFSAHGRLIAVDAAKLPNALVPAALGLGGFFSGTVSAEGARGTPVVTAAVDWSEGKVRSLSDLALHAEATLDAGRLRGALRGTERKAQLEGTFDFPLKLGKAPADAPLSLAVQFDGLPFSELFNLAGRALPLEGALRLGATLQGTVGQPRLALDASTVNATLTPRAGRADVPIHSASVSVETNPDGSPAVRGTLTALEGTLRFDATTPRPLSALLWKPPDLAALRALEWTANLTLEGVSLTAAQPVLPESLGKYAGTLALEAHATGPARDPSAQAHLKLADFSAPEFKPVQVAVDVDGAPGSLAAEVSASHQGKALVALHLRSAVSLARLLEKGAEVDSPFSIKGTLGPIDLTQLSALRGDDHAQMSGRVEATLDAGGTLGSPTVGLRAAVEKLALQKTALGKGTLALDYQQGAGALNLAMTSTNGGQLWLKGDVGLDLGLAALKKNDFAPSSAALHATLASRGFDLSFLSGAHPALRSVGGLVTADARLGGTLGAPAIDGQVVWTHGRLGIAGVSEFRDLELVAKGNNDRVSIDKLDARSGAGTLAVRGEARRQSPALWAFSGKVDTDKLPLVTDDQLRCILDVRATLAGELSPTVWNVKRLEIPEAHIQLPVVKKKNAQSIERPGDIVLVREGVAVGPRPRRWKKKDDAAREAGGAQTRAVVVRAAVNAPRNLWIHGTDVNLEVGLSNGFNLEYDRQLYLNGDVLVLRGKVEVIGRKFDIQRDSAVRFSGPASTPSLNVTAAYNNEREKVTVYATLVGSADDINFRTSSQPPLSDAEIYTLLATGRRSLRSGSGESAISGEQGLSVLGSLVASQLKTALTEKMPIELLDVLEISAGGTGGFAGARLEAGKYLSDQLYIGYVGQVGADPRKGENGNAGRVEYQFAPGWSVQGTVGDAPAGTAELVWGIDF